MTHRVFSGQRIFLICYLQGVVEAGRPLVSVVVVNWNRRADVRFSLDYLARVRYPAVEPIVVDNGSADGSVEEFAARSELKLVPLERNDGPCAARNAGVRAARGKYVFFLDSDAVLGKRTLNVLVDRLERAPDVALVACRIDNWWTRRIDQWIFAMPHRRREHQVFDAYSFSAAGALARRDVLLSVGGFDERLWIYNEETDLAIRLLRAGHRLVYDSAGRVYHRPSERGRAPGHDYWRLMIRNWIWIFHRYYPPFEAWRRTALYAAVYLYKGVRLGEVRSCWQGIKEGLAGRRPAGVAAEPKLTPTQVARIDALNRRRRIILGRG